MLVWRGKRVLESATSRRYPLTRGVAVVSGVTGSWFHVLLDAVMHDHLRPFYPLAANPFFLAGSADALHVVCGLLVVPAMALFVRHRYWRTLPQKVSFGLLGASAVGMAISAAAGVV